VFNAPVLQKHIKLTPKHQRDPDRRHHHARELRHRTTDRSALRKKINETLLDITADGTYDELYSKYFEDANSG
jgi:ABC-type amino acid transport substrate-binding protein